MSGNFIRFPYRKRPQKNTPGWIVDQDGCHIWTGSRSGSGYARVRIKGRMEFVHRIRYELEVGPIPEGLQLDHYVCDNGTAGCCNPHHCRPATGRLNKMRSQSLPARNARKTHCRNGHELSEGNLVSYDRKKGRRRCRICALAYSRERKRQLRGAA